MHTWNNRLLAFSLLIAAGALTGCQSYETVARESFANDRSCPLAGVTAVEHPEVSAHDLIFGPISAPPADIANDPARVAIWRAKQEDLKKTWDGSTKVFEVAGCKEKSYYTCSGGGKSGRRTCNSRKKS